MFCQPKIMYCTLYLLLLHTSFSRQKRAENTKATTEKEGRVQITTIHGFR